MHFGMNLAATALPARAPASDETAPRRPAACSQTSSTGPGHVHGSVFVSSSTSLKPALRNTARQTAGLGKPKWIRSAPARATARPHADAPRPSCSANKADQTDPRRESTPALPVAARAAIPAMPTRGSRKNITPKREVARSKLLSGKGRLCASACCVVKFVSPRVRARCSAISSKSALKIERCYVSRALPRETPVLIAGSPVPLARSSTCIPGSGCAYSTSASVTGCAHGGRLRLPLFRRHQPVLRSPVWLGVWLAMSWRIPEVPQEDCEAFAFFFLFAATWLVDALLDAASSSRRRFATVFRSEASSRLAVFHSRSRS